MYERKAVYYREENATEWELLGVFEDHTDARDVAKFFTERDKGQGYIYTTTDKNGNFEDPPKA